MHYLSYFYLFNQTKEIQYVLIMYFGKINFTYKLKNKFLSEIILQKFCIDLINTKNISSFTKFKVNI